MVTYEELRDELAEILFEAHYGEDTKRLMYPHVTYKRLATAAIATILEALQYRTKLTGSPGIAEWLAASPLVEEERR